MVWSLPRCSAAVQWPKLRLYRVIAKWYRTSVLIGAFATSGVFALGDGLEGEQIALDRFRDDTTCWKQKHRQVTSRRTLPLLISVIDPSSKPQLNPKP